MSPGEDKAGKRKDCKGPGDDSGGGQEAKDDQYSPRRRTSPQKEPVLNDHTGIVSTPPPALGSALKGIGGEGSSTGRGKKRGRPPKNKEATTSRPLVPGEGAAERPKKKVKFDAPLIPRPCSECGRQFNNYKALFGHMRTHPNRDWRGAFPPPSVSPPRSPLSHDLIQQGDRAARHLLSIGKRIIKSSKEDCIEPAKSVINEQTGSIRQIGLDIDLNMPFVPMPSEPSSPAVEADESIPKIDLNKEASEDIEGDNQ